MLTMTVSQEVPSWIGAPLALHDSLLKGNVCVDV
jgi:hypothetical protein